ncbi:MAG TPA: DUF2089 domain-containing protein [Actinomycetota bacterium]|nr:DUF2089 domain-containing protein [Actinomycetota bacterium]
MKRSIRAPRNCPVCSEVLALTRLSCDNCGTELSGHFPTCEYCELSDDARETLRIFLSSRGNMKEVERHLGVSYPTARARFEEILVKLGMDSNEAEPESRVLSRDSILEALSRGEIAVEDALNQLAD